MSDRRSDPPGDRGRPARFGLVWDRRRRVDHRLLVVQFVVCISTWTVVVRVLSGGVSGTGLISSGVTGGVLVVISWALAKCGVPPAPMPPSARDSRAAEAAPRNE